MAIKNLCPGYVGPLITSGSTVVVTYTMRGRRIATGAAVVWYPTGAPDLTGASSGYPVGQVDQIVCLGSR